MNIWIIDANSGVTILYHNILGMALNEDLVSGLLAALNLFSERELEQSGIESIEMSGLRWVYEHAREHNLLFVAAEEKGIVAEILRSRLDVIKRDFITRYAPTPEAWKEKWNGSVDEYRSYRVQIEMLVEQWKQAEMIAKTAVLFDLLGVFQTILNQCIDVIERHTRGLARERIYRNLSNFYDRFIDAIDAEKDKELDKITFSRETGWNILSINALNADTITLPSVFIDIVALMKSFIVHELGHTQSLTAFSEELYPYLLNNWNLLEELNMEKPLLTVFLNI